MPRKRAASFTFQRRSSARISSTLRIGASFALVRLCSSFRMSGGVLEPLAADRFDPSSHRNAFALGASLHRAVQLWPEPDERIVVAAVFRLRERQALAC